MSPVNTTANLAVWGVNILMAAVIGITSWTVNRTVQQIDSQEVRIQQVERAIIRFETVPTDIREIKQDLKRHIIREQP